MPTPPSSPSPPPPPPMTEEEEAELMCRVMEDSMNTHNERQWVSLETALAHSATDDVAIPELEQAAMVKEEVKEEEVNEPPLYAWTPQLLGRQWDWPATTPKVANTLGVGPWLATSSRSPEPEQEPRKEEQSTMSLLELCWEEEEGSSRLISTSLSMEELAPFVFFIFAVETSVDRFELSPPAAMVGGSSSKKSSAQQASSQGAWLGSDVDEGTSMRFVTIDYCPRPPKCRSFFAEWLQLFGLQPHHLAPNAILQLAAFVVLCEGFVGIEPRVDLWRSLFFFKQQSIAMEKSEVEKLKGPRPMTPCGDALVHHRLKSGFPHMPLQDSIKHWQKGFFYVKSADPVQDALNMPPFAIAPPTRRNWDAKTPRPHPEVALICAHLDILGKSGLLGRDLLATMVVRRILPLQRRPHLVCEMSGRLDPCQLSTKRFTPGAVARRVNLISTARMDEGGEWTWGMSPFNRAHPPPMMFKTLQGSLRQPAPDVEVSDTSEMEDEGAMEPRSDSSAGSGDPLESEGTEPSGEYPRHAVADWTDDDEEASFCSDAAFEEDSNEVEEVTSPLLTRGRCQGAGATAADEAAGNKGKGATTSRPASKRPAPGPPAGQRAHGAKRRRGGGRRQVSVVAGEAEDADEDTTSAAERAGWAAADAVERELEIESKHRWDTAAGKAAVGQPRPSRVERSTEKRAKARQDPSAHARVEEPASEAASRAAPMTEGAQPSEPAPSEQVDLETIPVSPRAEAAPNAPVLDLTAPDAAPDAPGATMDAPDATHPPPAGEVAPVGTAPEPAVEQAPGAGAIIVPQHGPVVPRAGGRAGSRPKRHGGRRTWPAYDYPPAPFFPAYRSW
ncbi:hypothetical protein D1007_10741 [Hordeum vulgare]|nr:hypothetical protein D1007_10741 [Hordeum vulgare]